MVAELDEIFDGAASPAYIDHIAQDWSAEPFIRQAYLADHADWRTAPELGRPGSDCLYFAGDAYTALPVRHACTARVVSAHVGGDPWIIVSPPMVKRSPASNP